jgi:hypothetical protein
MSTENVLLVALDGLDKELIDDFGLENVNQEEYGKIDNQTGSKYVKTSELFASFITGTNHEEHGVTGLTRSQDSWKWRVIDSICTERRVTDVRGFYRLKMFLKWFLNADDEIRYTKEDLEVDTLFEKTENSRAMFVPSYNPDILWEAGLEFEAGKFGRGKEGNARYWDERSYEIRKEKFLHELENDIVSPRDFLMVHFHRPDLYQHMYGDPSGDLYDEEKLRELYRETDEFAGEVKEKALEAGYDRIIFMSDHGLPEIKEHNENAFYSCNKELFGSKVPKLTDFHDRILSLTQEK